MLVCRHIPDVALCHFEPHRYRVGNCTSQKGHNNYEPTYLTPLPGIRGRGTVELGKVSIDPNIEVLWPCLHISCHERHGSGAHLTGQRSIMQYRHTLTHTRLREYERALQ